MSRLTVIHGDCLEELRKLPAESVQTCVTSPPYWGLRKYLSDNAVVISPSLSVEDRRAVESELKALGVLPKC